MKTTLLGLIVLGFAIPAVALEKTELDNRIRTLTAKFEALQENPEKRIPAQTLRKAQGVILLDRTKAGFLFAYQGGSGVAMVKDTKTEKWGPAAFMTANEASLGFQIGGEQAFYAILLMDTNALRLLTESKVEFGGEARGTAGDDSAGQEGKITKPQASVIVYDDRHGFYGGAAVKGGAVSPDEKANRAYYEQVVSVKAILFGKAVQPTPSAAELAGKLTGHSKEAKK